MFDDMAGVWKEVQSLTSADGLVSSQTMVFRPIADGTCTVELLPTETPHHKASAPGAAGKHSRGHLRHSHGGFGHAASPASSATGGTPPDESAEYQMTLAEQSDSVLVLTAYSRRTGKPMLVETITLLSDMRRCRAVQRFDSHIPNGVHSAFQCLYLINEERVLDSVSGAVMEPPRRHSVERHNGAQTHGHGHLGHGHGHGGASGSSRKAAKQSYALGDSHGLAGGHTARSFQSPAVPSSGSKEARPRSEHRTPTTASAGAAGGV
jgi:hypothetical protein